MLKNYIKTAWRSLLKDKQGTLLNLLGLSTGLACTLLIYLWVSDELNVDKFNSNDSGLYTVFKNTPNADGSIFTSPITQGLLAKSMAEDLPEVQHAVSVFTRSTKGIISVGEKHIKAMPQYAGKDFFNVFSYKLLRGSHQDALASNNGMLISDKLALSLFNTTDVVGKAVEWNNANEFNGPYAITGIFEAPPANATNQFDILFPYQLFADKKAGTMGDITNWGSNMAHTYIALKQGVDAAQFANKVKGYTQTKIKRLYPGNADMVKYEGSLFLQKYSDGYLHNHFSNGLPEGGRIEYVKLFSAVALFILVIACINFMNLSTARASRRMKEVGIRKVIGAKRSALALQYLGESVLMAFIALAIALLLVVLLLPAFREITGKSLNIQISIGLVLSVLGITVVTGLLAGSYPALYLSGFKPVSVLKGKLTASLSEGLVRKGLVVFQFVISVTLILGVLVVHKQMNLVQTKNLGYTRDNIIHFTAEGNVKQSMQAFVNEVKTLPGVVAASSMDGNMTGSYSQGGGGIGWPGKGPNDGVDFEGLDLGDGMMEMLSLQLKEGRSFSSKFADSGSVIFNETAIAAMHLKNPVGQVVTLWGKPMQIIGVVKDFQFESMYQKTGPFFLRTGNHNSDVYIKIKAGSERETLTKLSAFCKQFNTGLPFEYKFLDDDYAALYASEQRVALLSQYFAGLAVIISCLGLFGLVAYTAQKRQKEIGIRKVIGATVPNVVLLLSKDFLQLVLLATFIAFPLSWWAMHSWLQSFAYRVNIGIGVFVLTGVAIACITLVTISFQAVKAAMMNPAKSINTV